MVLTYTRFCRFVGIFSEYHKTIIYPTSEWHQLLLIPIRSSRMKTIHLQSTKRHRWSKAKRERNIGITHTTPIVIASLNFYYFLISNWLILYVWEISRVIYSFRSVVTVANVAIRYAYFPFIILWKIRARMKMPCTICCRKCIRNNIGNYSIAVCCWIYTFFLRCRFMKWQRARTASSIRPFTIIQKTLFKNMQFYGQDFLISIFLS